MPIRNGAPGFSVRRAAAFVWASYSVMSRRLKAEHRQSRLLGMLKSAATVQELSERLSVSERTINEDLRPLVKTGLVAKRGRTGRGGGVQYFIAPGGDTPRT